MNAVSENVTVAANSNFSNMVVALLNEPQREIKSCYLDRELMFYYTSAQAVSSSDITFNEFLSLNVPISI